MARKPSSGIGVRYACAGSVAAALFLCWWAAGLARVARAQVTSNANSTAVQLDLKTTLEKGLRCRRPEEFAFVEREVQLVDDGTLPEVLVRTTFGYARKKRPYPFPYFERILKLRAEQIGVTLDLVAQPTAGGRRVTPTALSTLRGLFPTFKQGTTR